MSHHKRRALNCGARRTRAPAAGSLQWRPRRPKRGLNGLPQRVAE